MNPQADINFERELWETAVTLRGTVASADYKHYVLPLLFLHHLADGGTAFPWQATTRGRHGETRRVQGQEDTLSKPIPLDYGKFYHIYSRGIDRCTIFFEERNYRFFMKRWAQYVEPVADTFAYALLGNHFHAIIRTRTAEEQEAWHAQTLRVSETRRVLKPSQQIGNVLNSYTKAINEARGRTGSLFQHPFGRIEVTTETYLRNLVTYIHQNPQRHGLVADFRLWPYSSYDALRSEKQTRLKRDDVLAWFTNRQVFEDVHAQPISDAWLAPLVLEDF